MSNEIEVNPLAEEAHWRRTAGLEFEQYEPAYRYGWESGSRSENQGRSFDDIEHDLATNWNEMRGKMTSEWSDIRQKTRAAFERVQIHTKL